MFKHLYLKPFDRAVKPANAVAAVITTNKNEILLQHRDAIPNIFYPNYWGCFGGAVEIGETDEEAISRELWEEIGLKNSSYKYFTRVSLDFYPIGGKNVYRTYFHILISEKEVSQIKLSEGSEYAFIPENKMRDFLITPYDKFALDLYFSSITL